MSERRSMAAQAERAAATPRAPRKIRWLSIASYMDNSSICAAKMAAFPVSAPIDL